LIGEFLDSFIDQLKILGMEYLTDEEIKDVITSHKEQYFVEGYFVKILESLPQVTWTITKENSELLRSCLSHDELKLNAHLSARKMKTKTYSSEKLKKWLNSMKEMGFQNEELIYEYFTYNQMKISNKKRKISKLKLEVKESKESKIEYIREVEIKETGKLNLFIYFSC
jgi:hypothetical protein